MTIPCRLANRAWYGLCLPAWQRYRAALRDPVSAQWNVLKRILKANETSAFGKVHRFGRVKSIRDFQSAVPLSTYDDFRDDIRCGEPYRLTADRVMSLVPTGGSTTGAKLIPHTPSLRRSFHRAIAPWIVDLHQRYPKIRKGSAYWAITPAGEGRESDDTTYLGGWASRLVRLTLAVPPSVAAARDIEECLHQTAVHLMGRKDLGFISVWHPSFLSLLLNRMEAHWSALSREIPDLRRRAEVEQMSPEVSRLWPDLQLVSCWGDARATGPMAELQERLPGAAFQSKGILATEGCVSIPFQGRHPVALTSNFFEFLDDADTPHLLHELTVGQAYRIVMTTPGGLYRYQLGDYVVVDGMVQATPSLRFAGRGDQVCDLVGEKLNESFVERCMAELLGRYHMCPAFSMLSPNDSLNGYVLHLSEAALPAGFAEAFQEALCANPQYAYACHAGQLGRLQVQLVGEEAYGRYVMHLHHQYESKIGAVKPASLRPEREWTHILQ